MSRSPSMGFPVSMCLRSILMIIGTMYWGSVRAQTTVEPWDSTTWLTAHATFYGGDDASGTMGGACGYGDMYTTGYGLNTAALSSALFNSGLSCGACYEIQCIVAQSKWCYANATSITVTATNLCPANWARTTDGWCNPPQEHFDLSYPMFAQLAQKVGGIIPIQFRRTSCIKSGGIRYLISGNPWFNLVLVYNVGGSGNVVSMGMKGNSTTTFYTMTRNWGQYWDLRQELCGQAISFQVTLGNAQQLTSTDVAPSSWVFGQTYECIYNFS